MISILILIKVNKITSRNKKSKNLIYNNKNSFAHKQLHYSLNLNFDSYSELSSLLFLKNSIIFSRFPFQFRIMKSFIIKKNTKSKNPLKVLYIRFYDLKLK